MTGIPRKMRHIWIGPHPAPTEWMQTWRTRHPGWSYELFDNDALSRRHFRTQRLIDHYLNLRLYAGAADLIRYELLHAEGGLIPGADSICLRAVDGLLDSPRCYTVLENEYLRGRLVSPILACEPGNAFVKSLVDRLDDLSPDDLLEPWVSTGNLFVTQMIDEFSPDIKIFPSHMFNPVHYTGLVYQGLEAVYACQLFGSTRSSYPKASRKKADADGGPLRRFAARRRRRREAMDFRQRQQAFAQKVEAVRQGIYDRVLAELAVRHPADTRQAEAEAPHRNATSGED